MLHAFAAGANAAVSNTAVPSAVQIIFLKSIIISLSSILLYTIIITYFSEFDNNISANGIDKNGKIFNKKTARQS